VLALGDRIHTVIGDNGNVSVCGVKSSGKSYLVKPDKLSQIWQTGLNIAAETLKKTTQHAVRDWSSVTGARRVRPTQFQLEYPRIRCDVYADVKYGPCKSIDGNTCLAVYATDFCWSRAYPLKTESDVSHTLKKLFRHIGFPKAIRPDDAQSLTQGEFKRVANKAQVPILPNCTMVYKVDVQMKIL